MMETLSACGTLPWIASCLSIAGLAGAAILCVMLVALGLRGIVLRIMRESGRRLSELADRLKLYPQKLINVKITRKTPFEQCEKLMAAQKDIEETLGSHGRVLLRYSGTENLCRVMVEGEDEDFVRRAARQLAEVAGEELR